MQEVYRQRVREMFDVMDKLLPSLSMDKLIEETYETAFGNYNFSGVRRGLDGWNFSRVWGYYGSLKLWVKWRFLKQKRRIYRDHGPNPCDYEISESGNSSNWMQVMMCCEKDDKCVEINLIWNMIPTYYEDDVDDRAWRVNIFDHEAEPVLEQFKFSDFLSEESGYIMFKPLAERVYEREMRRWKQQDQILGEQECKLD